MLEFSGKKPLSPPELLSYWIEEREGIRLRKESGQPKPWSTDPIFQTTYFTNIHREDDKVTRWLRANWLVDDKNYEFAMVLARLVNKPSTLSMIGYPYYGNGLASVLNRVRVADFTCQMEDIPFWGSAYVVTTHGQRMSKLQYLLNVLEGAHRVLPLPTLQGGCAAYHSAFKRLEGFSDFMAAQIVADLKNTAFHPLAKAPDWHTFVAPGPGSKKGMNYFFGLEPERSMSTAAFVDGIKEIRHGLEDLNNTHIYDMCNQDLQNCLCEFSKYMRIRNGTGRSKRKYDGR